jgi:AraC-like DNA-binding protein
MSTLPASTANELMNELLLGMRVCGVQYRRSAIAPAAGIGFTNVAGRAQFHFVARGPVWLRSPAGTVHALDTGDAVLLPHGGLHAMLAAADTAPAAVTPIDATSHGDPAASVQLDADDVHGTQGPVIVSCCMALELGGMQPLVDAMPEVMAVSTLLDTSPELAPMLAAMERESMTVQAGETGIVVRLVEVVAALLVRGWVAGGCGNASGWVGALHDPRLSRAIVMMHKEPGRQWTVATLANEAGNSRSVFARRFLLATGVSPLRYLTDLRMRLAIDSLARAQLPVDVVASQLGYGSLAAFSRAFKRAVGTSPGALRARPAGARVAA